MKQRKQARPYSAGLRQVTIEGSVQQHRGIQYKGSPVTLEQLMLIKQDQNYTNVIDQSMDATADLIQKQQSNVNMISSASQRYGTIGNNRWKNYDEINQKKTNITNQQQDISRMEKEKKTIDKFGILQLIEKKKIEHIDKVEQIINEIQRKKKFDIGFHEQMKKDLDSITDKFKKTLQKFQALNENTFLNFNLIKKLEEQLVKIADCYRKQLDNNEMISTKVEPVIQKYNKTKKFLSFNQKSSQLISNEQKPKQYKFGDFQPLFFDKNFNLTMQLQQSGKQKFELHMYNQFGDSSFIVLSENSPTPVVCNFSEQMLYSINKFDQYQQQFNGQSKENQQYIQQLSSQFQQNQQNYQKNIFFKKESQQSVQIRKDKNIDLSCISDYKDKDVKTEIFSYDDFKHDPTEPIYPQTRIKKLVKSVNIYDSENENDDQIQSKNKISIQEFQEQKNPYVMMKNMNNQTFQQKQQNHVCNICQRKKETLAEFVFEILKIDLIADSEEKRCSEIIQEFIVHDPLFGNETSNFEESISQLSESYKICLKNFSQVLPLHASFFEKMFLGVISYCLISLYKQQFTVDKVLSDKGSFDILQEKWNKDQEMLKLQEKKLKQAEELVKNNDRESQEKQYLFDLDIQYLRDLNIQLQNKIEAAEAQTLLYQQERDEAIKIMNLKDVKVTFEKDNNIQQEDDNQIISAFIKKNQVLQTDINIESMGDLWHLSFHQCIKQVSKYIFQDNMKKALQLLNLQDQEQLLYLIAELLSFFTNYNYNSQFKSYKLLYNDNFSNFQYSIIDYLIYKDLPLESPYYYYAICDQINNAVQKNIHPKQCMLKQFSIFYNYKKSLDYIPMNNLKQDDELHNSIQEKIFSNIFYGLFNNTFPGSSSKNMPNVKVTLATAIDYFNKVFKGSYIAKSFVQFLNILIEHTLYNQKDKQLEGFQKVQAIIAAQIHSKCTGTLKKSKMMQLQFVRNQMLLSINQLNERIQRKAVNFDTRIDRYYVSDILMDEIYPYLDKQAVEREKFGVKNRQSRVNKKDLIPKKKKDYDVDSLNNSFEYNEVLSGKLTPESFGCFMHHMQLYVFFEEYFQLEGVPKDEINSKILSKFSLQQNINGIDFINSIKPYIVELEQAYIKLIDLSCIFLFLSNQFITEIPKLIEHQFGHLSAGLDKISKKQVLQIINQFDFKKGLKKQDKIRIIHEIDMQRFSVLYNQSQNGGIIKTKGILPENDDEPLYRIVDLQKTLNFETVATIYSNSIVQNIQDMFTSEQNQ